MSTDVEAGDERNVFEVAVAEAYARCQGSGRDVDLYALIKAVEARHAHELAVQQRETIPDIMESWGGHMHQDMLTELADSIDPEEPK